MLLADSIGSRYLVAWRGARFAVTTEAANVFLRSLSLVHRCRRWSAWDMMAGDPPYIFRQHIMRLQLSGGALLFCFLRTIAPQHIAMLSGAILIVVIRLLASHYRWSLPKPGHRS